MPLFRHSGLDPESSGFRIPRIYSFSIKPILIYCYKIPFFTFLLYNKMNISIKEVKTMHESTGGADIKVTAVAPPIRLTAGYS